MNDSSSKQGLIRSLNVKEKIKIVENGLTSLLNFVDTIKHDEKCGDNLALRCVELQKNVEYFILTTNIEAQFILDFTNMSIRYWLELNDLHKGSQKINRKLNNANSSSGCMKDPNSVFNTIRSSIETIPILNHNESITSNPKTYHYMEIMEQMENVNHSSSSSSSTTNSNLLSHYKTIISSNKLNSEVMTTFIQSLNKMQIYPTSNKSLYDKIIDNIDMVKYVLSSQLQSSGQNEKEITRIMSKMNSFCDHLLKSMNDVIKTINDQVFYAKDYLLNTILYWVKLNELQQVIIIKIGNQFVQQHPLTTNNTSTDSSSSSSPKPKSKLATIF